jgi:hypothetical protein
MSTCPDLDPLNQLNPDPIWIQIRNTNKYKGWPPRDLSLLACVEISAVRKD